MGNVAATARRAVARVNAVVTRRQIRVIPSSDATLRKLAKDPYVTVGLTPEQAKRLEDIERASEPAPTHPASR